MKVVTAFFDAPVYRLQQSRDVIRPRQRDANFLQRFISGANEFLNAWTHFADLFARENIILEVPSSAFEKGLEKVIFTSRLRIERLTRQLFDGQITPQQYQARMIAEVRRVNLAAFLLGIKGLGNVTPEAVQAMGVRMNEQLDRLRRFMADSFGPNLTQPLNISRISEAQFRAYSNRFASAGRASSTVAQSILMENLYGAAIETGGQMYMRRVVVGDDNSCESCVEYASVGWVLVGGGLTLPPPGTQCECEDNCRCLMEYCLSFGIDSCPDDYG